MNIEPKKDTLWKTYLVYFLVLAFGIAIITKIVLILTKERKQFTELAEKREYDLRTLEASRGNIFAADGQLLATSIPIFDLFFDSRVVSKDLFVSGIDTLSFQLAKMFPKRNATSTPPERPFWTGTAC